VRTEYAQQYRELWQRHWWWRSREAWVLGWIERLNRRSPCHRILDVGCGDGLFFDRLAQFGEVEGLEPDRSIVSDSRWRDRILNARLEAGFRAAKPYRLILLLDVLEHIGRDDEALAAARGALEPGGHVLLTVPALPWLWSRHDEVNEHYRRYTTTGLREVLAKAGFAVEQLRHFFLWTIGPMLARRALAPAGVTSGEYSVPIPPQPLNAALERLSRFEHALGQLIPWPIGSSILAVARRD
jgi:2-polyprenyl-3-methyl-5-hydroxy-6-metoxy-1,4-benzoquinol methylase